MDGYHVMTIDEAAKFGDVFITATGGINAIDGPHFGMMKDGAIIANSGHFNVEINIPELQRQAKSHRIARHLVEEYTLSDSRRIFLLGEGRLINLAAAEGHPSAVMDMSFANQALSLEYLQFHHKELAPGVYPVPSDQDASVATLKLASMGIGIDALTKEQSDYLQSWEAGT